MHRLPLPAASIALLAAGTLAAGGGVVFGPPRVPPGQSVRLTVHTEVVNGTAETNGPAGRSTATMRVDREREVVWTVRQPAQDGSPQLAVRIPRFEATTTMIVGGRPDVTTERSPLTGRLLAASRKPSGEWVFEGDGLVIGPREQATIDELTAYQTRKWYPDHEVGIGDSWEFEPKWIELVVQRELRESNTVGTMTLRQIRRTRDAQVAVADVAVRSTGSKLVADGRRTGAAINFRGKVTINLETMLDEAMELEGTVQMQVNDGAKRTEFTLPMRMTANKRVELAGAPQRNPLPRPAPLPTIPSVPPPPPGL